MSDESGYKVYFFRNGRRESLSGDRRPRDLKKYAATQRLAADSTEIVETQIEVRANSPSQRGRTNGVKHKYSHLEHQRPETLFVGIIGVEEFYRQSERADSLADTCEARAQELAAELLVRDSKEFVFEKLPERWKAKLHRCGNDCWIWPTLAPEAPYLRVYRTPRGAIPKGLQLRHICHDRHCVNPNHLIPGTAKDNADDMVKAQRHHQQQRTAERQTRRRKASVRRH